jgi:hypothetical protein
MYPNNRLVHHLEKNEMIETKPEQQHQFKELDKFTMYTNAPGVENRRSRLQWSSYRGNPRITVFTGVPTDTNKGVISAAMNPETFFVFLELMKEVIESRGETRRKIDCDTNLKAADNTMTKERILSSSIVFGKDSAGVVWISLVAENRPKIKFDFKISDYHRIYQEDGTQFTEAQASCLQARAATTALKEIMAVHAAELRPPYVPGANAKGSYNNSPKPKRNIEFDDLPL